MRSGSRCLVELEAAAMTDVDDVARFTAREDDAIVMAALMCPYCLGHPAHVLVNDVGEGANAMCACAECELQWSVGLDPEQAMRMFLAPPRGLWIQHRFGGQP
jgi:hypothetical protein